jgi:LPS export ABC transporter protein LptC
MQAAKQKNLILVTIAMVTGIFFFSCKTDIKAIQEIGEEDTAPFQTVLDGKYTFTESGKVRNILTAGLLAQYVQDTDYVRVEEGLVLDIYNRQEGLAGSLAADKGFYFKKQNRMEAWDNVVFTNPNGDSLFTDQLTWLSDSNLITTDSPVRIIREGTEIRGKGLRANEDFSRYSILAPIGDITVPEQAVNNESEERQ